MKKDSVEIYNLLLSALKTNLTKKEVKDSTIKIALDFVKTFEMDKDLEMQDRNIDEFISRLPFRIKEDD